MYFPSASPPLTVFTLWSPRSTKYATLFTVSFGIDISAQSCGLRTAYAREGNGNNGCASVPDNPDKPGDGEGESLWDKLGKFLGSVLGGLLDLIGSVIGGILDGLITLVTTTFERLSQLVNLFGSFGDALGVLWTWLPPEIMSVLVAGVTVFVLIALLKLFLK